MRNVEATFHYIERWFLAIVRAVSQIKGKNTKRVDELRSHMKELIRLGHEMNRVYMDFAIDHLPEQEHKFDAIVERYGDWFREQDGTSEIIDQATRIVALTEVHSNYEEIRQKATSS